MSPRSARHTILSEIAPFEKEGDELRIFIETPKGSRNKYSYDPECDCMQLSTVLPEGMSFPYDFGCWLCRSHPQRRKAGRSPGPGADQV